MRLRKREEFAPLKPPDARQGTLSVETARASKGFRGMRGGDVVGFEKQRKSGPHGQGFFEEALLGFNRCLNSVTGPWLRLCRPQVVRPWRHFLASHQQPNCQPSTLENTHKTQHTQLQLREGTAKRGRQTGDAIKMWFVGFHVECWASH